MATPLTVDLSTTLLGNHDGDTDSVGSNGTPRTPSGGYAPGSPSIRTRKHSARTPLLSRAPSRGPGHTLEARVNEFISRDPPYAAMVNSIEAAIEDGHNPKLISQGSSGSYFCSGGDDGGILAVFKPKDEEPYGEFNPKWNKYIQRILCPCCFGRGCLVNNHGYLSEAGAYVVDEFFKLSVVPPTRVVLLSSPSFHYSKVARLKAEAVDKVTGGFPDLGRHLQNGLPLKMGSLQKFVSGYKDASVLLKKLDWATMPPHIRESFQRQFERLVVLDYLIRNTDRGMDNWLIKITEVDGVPESIHVAAIDNGLAFPHKHPDDWRAYPYHWAYLAQAKTPFSQETANLLLPILSDDDRVESLVSRIYDVFTLDKHFSKGTFERQMAVMRGQMVNLREALRKRKSPLQLVQMPNAMVMIQHRTPQRGRSERTYRQVVAKRLPFFTNW
eukprot:m.444763 g.444763  ORF g.444763 m.444763 type:complete len:442 (+) comp19143_c0_seq1:185-1510(+)